MKLADTQAVRELGIPRGKRVSAQIPEMAPANGVVLDTISGIIVAPNMATVHVEEDWSMYIWEAQSVNCSPLPRVHQAFPFFISTVCRELPVVLRFLVFLSQSGIGIQASFFLKIYPTWATLEVDKNQHTFPTITSTPIRLSAPRSHNALHNHFLPPPGPGAFCNSCCAHKNNRGCLNPGYSQARILCINAEESREWRLRPRQLPNAHWFVHISTSAASMLTSAQRPHPSHPPKQA